MEQITFIAGGGELLDQIEGPWLQLRSHHAGLSPLWRDGLLAARFDERKAELLRKGTRGLRVMLAKAGGHVVGYCVSTISPGGEGEIDSIFVIEALRGRGIGKKLVQDALKWLHESDAEPIVVEVMAGNETALKLYEQFGFQSRTVRMRFVGSGHGRDDHATDQSN